MEFQQRPQEYRAWYKKGYGEKMVYGLTPNEFNRRIPSNAETCMVLMEFIGKLDTNGKKIYVGDIVTGIVSNDTANICQGLIAENKQGQSITGYIDWAQLYCQYRFTTNGITYLNLAFGLREIEVIGNVFENLNLLNND